MRYVDRTNIRYGRLVALKRVGTNKCKKPLWECLCDCGKTCTVDSSSLSSGNTSSCGCFFKHKVTKHGGWKKRSYNTWRAMVRRCNNPKDKDYPNYGANNISVCIEWLDYLTFEKDMGEPVGNETLDRINTYGNYEPSNCRWAGIQTQNRNLKVRKNSITGYIGVSVVYGGKYMAKITVDKTAYYSKVFNTVEAAAIARKELERIYWGVR